MGALRDIIEKKALEIALNKIERESVEQAAKDEKIEKYNRVWLDRIVNEGGYLLTENEQVIENILKKLNERDGHCPCGGMTSEFLCPCRMMREHGSCKCGLYQNAVDLDVKASVSTGRIKE